jgi:poly-gamma-glutamate capsule biosynthesis protein CapA/YwtB (metallophosphatase superfamily)
MVLTVLSVLVLAAPPEPLIRLRAVGDVMLGTTVPEGKLPPDDGAKLLEGVTALLQDADLTFANFEGPLCDSGTSAKCRKGGNCFAFRTPTAYAKYLEAAGIDFGSTANNHSGDFGEACRRETEKALDAHHIAWSGPPGSIARVTSKGKKLAMVAFHTSAACNDVNDLAAAKKLVQQAKAESDLVIVSFHGGAEGTNATRVKDGAERYLGENRGDLKAFTHGVIDAGADLVLGHGPHVVRGMELYKDRLIAYSLGNFATYGRFDLSGPLGFTVMLEVSLAEDGRFAGGKLISTKQEGKGVPVPDDTQRGAKLVRQLTQLDFPKTGVRIDEQTFVLSAP